MRFVRSIENLVVLGFIGLMEKSHRTIRNLQFSEKVSLSGRRELHEYLEKTALNNNNMRLSIEALSFLTLPRRHLDVSRNLFAKLSKRMRRANAHEVGSMFKTSSKKAMKMFNKFKFLGRRSTPRFQMQRKSAAIMFHLLEFLREGAHTKYFSRRRLH